MGVKDKLTYYTGLSKLCFYCLPRSYIEILKCLQAWFWKIFRNLFFIWGKGRARCVPRGGKWSYFSLVKKMKWINNYLICIHPTSNYIHCNLTNLDASKTFWLFNHLYNRRKGNSGGMWHSSYKFMPLIYCLSFIWSTLSHKKV